MINIVEILKDCPNGTKLYSPLCGDCRLIKIYNGLGFDVINDTDDVFNFSYDGRYHLNGECCIFPSKDQRDWNKFQIPFNDGDIVFYNNTIAIFKGWGNETLFRTYCVFYTSVNKSIFSFELDRPLFGKSVRKEIRHATDDEKQRLFDTIKENGYKWNSETNTLEKLVIPLFKVGDRIKWNKTGNNYEIIKILSNCYIANYLGSDITILFNRQDEYELVPNKFDICNMRKFKYRMIDYTNYPSEEDLNKMGEEGCELVCIEPFEKRFFDDDLAYSYTKKIYKATFKKEIV